MPCARDMPSPTVRRLRAICTAAIVQWEHLLQAVHSLLYLLFFYSYWPSQRAWWDPSKGAAIVIAAPHNDAVARYLALRLSSGSPSSFAFKDAGQGMQAPYTCFVLHTDADQFAITVAQWAARKAEIERTRLSKSGGLAQRRSNASSPGAEQRTFGAQSVEGDPASPRKQRRARPPPIQIGSPSTSQHHRSRSWSSWVNPPDLFGYGADMLKGWRPGHGSKAESGTIIPIMADSQTQEGVAMVTSTISAYCTSHNLLLSGVILVPAVLCPRNVSLDSSAEGEGGSGKSSGSPPRDSFDRQSRTSSAGDVDSLDSWPAQLSPPASPGTTRLRQRQNDEHAALRSAMNSDVLQSRALLNALYPAVRRDRGRIVAFVPSGHGSSLPDVLSAQSSDVDSRGAAKSRQRSSSDRTPLQAWPKYVVSTVRDALRQQWTELSLDYARRSSAGRSVWVSTIETQALVQPLSTQKKQVQWDQSVYYSSARPQPISLFASIVSWLLSWVPFVSPRHLGLAESATTYEGSLQGEHATESKAVPGAVDPARRHAQHPPKPHAEPPSLSLVARLVCALLVRVVRVLRWLEACAVPFDDLSELVAAVSQPIPAPSRHADYPSSAFLSPYDVSPSAFRSARTGYFPPATRSPPTHQNPDPLFEALRSALASHHPRPTYTPSVAATLSTYTHTLAPWIHSHAKYALAHHILATTDDLSEH